jgi:hypothetical protein
MEPEGCGRLRGRSFCEKQAFYRMPWQSKQQTAASKKERVDHGDIILHSDSVHTLLPPYTADMLIALRPLLPYSQRHRCLWSRLILREANNLSLLPWRPIIRLRFPKLQSIKA